MGESKMTQPKVYEPVQGYKYQILCRHSQYNGIEWEHCDYATDKKDKIYLLQEYKLAYGIGYQFNTILLPKKYWRK